MTPKEIHKLSREIIVAIFQEFGIVLTIGIYAANDQGEYGEIQEVLNKIIKQYPQILQLHGFYVDNENISFDLIIDFKEEHPEKIKEEVTKKIKEKYPEYEYHVILDTDMSD